MSAVLEKRIERVEKAAALVSDDSPVWTPLPGPQTLAFESTADVIGFGGAAGGGKSDLAVGKALLKHQKVLVLRREATQLVGIVDRFTELLKGRDGFNGCERIWRLSNGKQIEFGSTPTLDDWVKYQGRPHDLLVFDEASNFLEPQVRALLGWLRSVDPNQKCQALLTFNPPTSADGRWIVDFFAPWIDKRHPNPAEPGEVRFFAMVEGREIEVPDETPFDHNGDVITPMSRTFIPSRLSDNPYLSQTGYMATLQSLPEPLRSQMLYGDFSAGIEDDAMQVIPTAWVELAMDRWKKLDKKPIMSCLGVDIARGGKDSTVISRRHGWWFDQLLSYPGSQTPNGPSVAGLCIAAMRDRCNLYLDVIGVGASPYDFLLEAKQPVFGVNVAERATMMDRSGRLRFANLRSQLWWQMREALDPEANNGIALPPDKELLSDLCAPKWSLRSAAVQVESRDEIVKRIGRSPDRASALILTMIEEPSIAELQEVTRQNRRNNAVLDYNPYKTMDSHHDVYSLSGPLN